MVHYDRELDAFDAYDAAIAERFIAMQPYGSGAWLAPSAATTTRPNITLLITDLKDTKDGDGRSIQVYRDLHELVVTLIYHPVTHELLRVC
jgi:hypothetical protein